jgi:2-polyprenyl-6-methoxyphenol hydroxylase-like FAD-dependent oxidoreductase
MVRIQVAESEMGSIDHDFDAIIVGARVAGTATAMMLGRKRLKVLLVDKSAFPSDTISTHIVLAGGTRVLHRLGVLDMLEHLGGVRFSSMRTAGPGFDYSARLDKSEDIRGLCLTRDKMDCAMVEAARSIECVAMREQFRVTDLVTEDGAIAGIRGEDSSGTHVPRAPLVIGADGLRSTFAKLASEKIGAFERKDVKCARAYYYAYFEGVPRAKLGDALITEFAASPGTASLACRCNGDLVVAAVAFDAGEMRDFRTDLSSNFMSYIGASSILGGILEGARIVGNIRSSGLLLNTWRDPVCDGAILLGDAGLHVDPLFGQGHSFALIGAEIFGELAPSWFEASRGAAIARETMSEFTRRRDAALMPYYNSSLKVSQHLGLDRGSVLAHLAANRQQWAAEEMVRFAQMVNGETPFPSFRFARLMVRGRAAA